MIVPIRGGEGRSGIGSVLSGRILFIEMCPPKPAAPTTAPVLVAAKARQVQTHEANSCRDSGSGPSDQPGMTSMTIYGRNGKTAPPFRKPSAAPFHCLSFSGILRGVFITPLLP